MDIVKISPYMRNGQALTKPLADEYFEQVGNDVYACAFGCAIYNLNGNQVKVNIDSIEECEKFLQTTIGFDAAISIPLEDVPDDILEEMDWTGDEFQFHHLVTKVNDEMGRSRAIKLVEELGY
jgi:hypothetical protein